VQGKLLSSLDASINALAAIDPSIRASLGLPDNGDLLDRLSPKEVLAVGLGLLEHRPRDSESLQALEATLEMFPTQILGIDVQDVKGQFQDFLLTRQTLEAAHLKLSNLVSAEMRKSDGLGAEDFFSTYMMYFSAQNPSYHARFYQEPYAWMLAELSADMIPVIEGIVRFALEPVDFAMTGWEVLQDVDASLTGGRYTGASPYVHGVDANTFANIGFMMMPLLDVADTAGDAARLANRVNNVGDGSLVIGESYPTLIRMVDEPHDNFPTIVQQLMAVDPSAGLKPIEKILYANKGYEIGVVRSATGEIRYIIEGNAHSMVIRGTDATAMRRGFETEGGIFIHNHPWGYSLSLSDYRTASALNAEEFIAVGATERYIFRRPNGGRWLSDQEMTNVYNATMTKILADAVDNGDISQSILKDFDRFTKKGGTLDPKTQKLIAQYNDEVWLDIGANPNYLLKYIREAR
jgi:hypothetical protein